MDEQEILTEKKKADKWMEEYAGVMHLPVNDKSVQALIKLAFIEMNKTCYRSVSQRTDTEGENSEFNGMGYQLLKIANAEAKQDSFTVDVFETFKQGMSSHYFEAMDYFTENEMKRNEEEYRKLR